MLIKKEKLIFDGMDLIVLFSFFLAILRSTIFFPLYPSVSFSPLGAAWYEAGLWFLAVCIVFYRLYKDGLFHFYLNLFYRNFIVLLFVSMALLSVFWAGSPAVTGFRFFELAASTLIAAYIGIRYDLEKYLKLVSFFGSLVLILSAFIIFRFPEFGIASGPPYYGAWDGIFWNRNQFGSFFALVSSLFFLSMLIDAEAKRWSALFWTGLCPLAIVFVVLSESATGIILLPLLFGVIVGMFLFVRFKNRLSYPRDYLLIGGFLTLLMLFGLLNLDPILGLFGRNSTFTGRIHLWRYLFENVVSLSPVFGHGFGYIWNNEFFRYETAQTIGWPNQVFIGDNGYMDILLHLGWVGVVLFLSFLFMVAYRSIQFLASYKNSLIVALPMLLLFYAVTANITFSMFAETEVFVWMQLVSVLFFSIGDK